MGVIIPDPEDMSNSSSALAAEIVAAMFDRPGYSRAIRESTRKWIAEQRKNGYKDAPQKSSGQEWLLLVFVGAVVGLAVLSLFAFGA